LFKLDSQGLEEKIRRAAESAFKQVRSRHPDEEFCGYALYSDADAITVCPSVNSRAHLEQMIANDPGDAEYYRWSPAEWNHEFEGAEHFQEISNYLRAEVKAIKSPEEHNGFKQQVYETCVNVLEDLKQAGFFSDLNESGVLVFAISDGDNESEVDWISRLNAPELAEQFRNWIRTL